MESEVNAFLAGYTPGVQMIVYELRALVLDVVPEAIEQIDVPAKLIAYGFRQTYKDTICVIMPLNAGVNLGFPRGIDLPDPASLLTGTGKKLDMSELQPSKMSKRLRCEPCLKLLSRN